MNYKESIVTDNDNQSIMINQAYDNRGEKGHNGSYNITCLSQMLDIKSDMPHRFPWRCQYMASVPLNGKKT